MLQKRRSTKEKLKEFEKRLNSAVAELCLKDVNLLENCGQLLRLLSLARKKVAKFSKDLREERLDAIKNEGSLSSTSF